MDRILIDLSGFGVFWLDVVLDKKTVLVIELQEATREAIRSTELVSCPAHISQTTGDLETIAAIAVTDLEPCGAVAELLAKAVPVHFLAVFLHGACNYLVVVDVVAEFFDVAWIRLGSVPDAEFSYVAASPALMDWLRPIWKDELIITGVPSRDCVMLLSDVWIWSDTECGCKLFLSVGQIT